jgi:peptidoglycan hydrolase-like protein with peptidoglycan-binding domain
VDAIIQAWHGRAAGREANVTARGTGIGEDEFTVDQVAAPTTTEAVAEEADGAGAVLVNVRVGGHKTFDRVVFDFDGPLPGHRVEFVDQVIQDGSGEPVPLRGRAFLQVVMTPAAAHDDDGAPTFPGPLPSVANLAALRDLADAGDFEAVLTWGIGVAARTGFRVLRLTNPTRIAVDVTHAPPGTGNQLLRRGSRGAAVATWQWRLRLALRRDLAVDEIFGPATEAATREFQRTQQLAVDGIVGPRSRAAMELVLGI